MKNNKKNRKIKMLVIFGASVLFLFLIFLIIGLGVYKFQWNNRFMAAVERILPLPAAYIRGAGMITVGEVKENEAAVKKFYESQDFNQIGMRVDFTTDQGKKRLKMKEKDVVNKMIENKIIESLASERGILLSDQTVNDEVSGNIEQFGNRENLMSDLGRLYGWTIEDFKEKVVKPELISEKLSESFSAEVDIAPQAKKAQLLWERVAKNKEDFASVAKENSDGKSSENGGDLGWSAKDQLVTEVSEKAFSMKPGEISEVISSPLGFHIIKMEEKKAEDGKDLVHLRQIFIKTATYADWLKEKIQKYSVTIFLTDYQWNKNEAQVEFKDEGMRKFERDSLLNSDGDPSIF